MDETGCFSFFWLIDGNFLLDVLIRMSDAMYMNMMNESFKEKTLSTR